MQQQAGCGSHCRSGWSMPHVAAATVGLSAMASANRCHHRLTDRVTVLDAQRCTCHMRQAGTDCTPLHLKCRGQTFWNCNFRLDFKVASAPYFACSSAAPLPCTSLTPLLLFVPGQHLPSTNATCCGGRLQVARADRAAGQLLRCRGKWVEQRQRGRQTWHTQQVFRFMFLRLDCSQNTNATNAARRCCCCCCSCCSCSRRFTLGVFIQNV